MALVRGKRMTLFYAHVQRISLRKRCVSLIDMYVKRIRLLGVSVFPMCPSDVCVKRICLIQVLGLRVCP